MNKLILVLVFTVLSINLLGQITKTQKNNFHIISDQEIISGTIKCVIEKTYDYDYKYGEYSKQSQLKNNYLYKFSSLGLIQEKINNRTSKSESYNFNINGQDLSKPNLKYKLNENDEIIEVLVYNIKKGDIIARYKYAYNDNHQIINCITFESESSEYTSKTTFLYNENKDLIKVISCYPPNTELAKGVRLYKFKAEYKYNNKHQLVTYKSYFNDYGIYDDFFDIYGNKLSIEKIKSRIENRWKVDKCYEFEYNGDDYNWDIRKEFVENVSDGSTKKYLTVTERINLNEYKFSEYVSNTVLIDSLRTFIRCLGTEKSLDYWNKNQIENLEKTNKTISQFSVDLKYSCYSNMCKNYKSKSLNIYNKYKNCLKETEALSSCKQTSLELRENFNELVEETILMSKNNQTKETVVNDKPHKISTNSNVISSQKPDRLPFSSFNQMKISKKHYELEKLYEVYDPVKSRIVGKSVNKFRKKNLYKAYLILYSSYKQKNKNISTVQERMMLLINENTKSIEKLLKNMKDVNEIYHLISDAN